MADDSNVTNVLLKLYDVQMTFCRQNEDQRAQITNMVLLIASAVIGFIAQKGLSFEVLPLTILLIALGIYGAVISEKLYERYGFSRAKAESVERKLEKLHPDAEIVGLWQEAKLVNTKEFPRLNALRLHHLWLVLHSGIVIAGIILTLFIAYAGRP